jgi:Domain of unknown function (DUF4251)
MKTAKIYSVCLIMAAGLILSTFSVSSQEKGMDRLERKEFKKAKMEASFRALDSLLTSRRFVLVADYLQDRYGERIPVLQTINFIKVNEETGVIQTGSSTALGYNGVGGVTAEGSLGEYKITKNFKSRSYTLRFTISTQIGFYDVLMTVNAANNASATITGTYPGKLTWEGHLEGLGYSKVYKGQNSI